MSVFLETPRLALRRFKPADLDDLYRLDSSPEVMRYISGGVPATREQVTTALGRVLAYYDENPGLGYWVAVRKTDDAFVGWACLCYLEGTSEVEVGYRLLPEFWGRGLATEAGRAMVEYGFRELGLDRIVGVAAPANKASCRVLEKLGLRFERMAHFYALDVAYFALERPPAKGRAGTETGPGSEPDRRPAINTTIAAP